MECPKIFITVFEINFLCRQVGQDSIDELREKDFRRDLEERERQAAKDRNRERGSRSNTESSSKRSRLDQAPPTNLDADDPVDDDDDYESDERFVNKLSPSRGAVLSISKKLGKNNPKIVI